VSVGSPTDGTATPISVAGPEALMTTFLLGVALTVTAPALKDRPPKEPSVVGRWTAAEVVIGGQDNGQHVGLEYQFTADGTWLIYRDGQRMDGARSYSVDPKAMPPAINLTENASVYAGIFKVDGDSLVVVFRTDKGARPTSFDGPAAGHMKVVMTREKD
jgi:uncharacterized protein (TIGR03067 family)